MVRGLRTVTGLFLTLAMPAGIGAVGIAMAEIGMAGPAAAETLPVDAVRQEVARHISDLWAVDEVTVREAAGAEAPTAAVTVRLRLTQPTFAIDRQEGEVAFLRPVADAGTEKVLTATASGARTDQGWTVGLTFQNADVLDSLGLPASRLPGRTAVVGSPEAQKLAAQLTAEAEARLAADKAQAARKREQEEILADNAIAEAERVAQQTRLMEARAQQMDTVRTRITAGEPAARIAAFEAAIGGDDIPLRQFALETAMISRDPTLINLALRDWLGRKKSVPVLLYATREDPASETVLRNLGPLTLEIQSFNAVSGNLNGRLGAPGYNITMPSAASGYLAQSELTVNAFGCTLALKLTENRTFDGIYRCQTLPALVARITLD